MSLKLRSESGWDGAHASPGHQAAHEPRSRVRNGAEVALPTASLSACERRVASLLSKGLSNTAIAKSINRSEETVKFHLKNVYLKLGVSSRVQLVLMMVGTEEAVSGPGRVKA